jgi:hypothetical protein
MMPIQRNPKGRLQGSKKDVDKGYVEALKSLKTKISQLPNQYPYEGQVFGSGTAQAKLQIPIICQNIDDAIDALMTLRDSQGNPITPTQVGDGLKRLVQATRKPGFTGLLSAVLSTDRGVKELEKSMDELERIADQLGIAEDPGFQQVEIPSEEKPGKKEIRLFINDLISDDSHVRQRGFMGLKKAGDVTVKPLIETLEHENLMLRRQAAEALGMNNTRSCIQGLLNVFSDQRAEMFRRANYALWLIGEPTVSPLIEKLRDDDPDVRGRAAVVLGQMIYCRRGDPSHRIWLDPSAIDITDNLRDDINVRVVRSEAMGPLEELLQDEDASVREYASYALKKLRG